MQTLDGFGCEGKILATCAAGGLLHYLQETQKGRIEQLQRLARDVVTFVQALRQQDLYKLPGVAETLDWMAALIALDREDLSEEVVNATLGVLLKYQDDTQLVQGPVVQKLMARIEEAGS